MAADPTGESRTVDEQHVLYQAITFSSSEGRLGNESWSVNVRATLAKLHEAGYCIAPLSGANEVQGG
jgi:hypothetical protein